MKRQYDLWLHYKQGDDFSGVDQSFEKWSDHFEECMRQTDLLAQHSSEIHVIHSDVHFIALEIEEELANRLIAQGVNLNLDEYAEEECV